MADGDWTARNECRMALRRVVWKHHTVCVTGPMWNALKPSGSPPSKGFACNSGKWLTEMGQAQQLLTKWGYLIEPVGDINDLLNQSLQASIQRLFNLIQQNRAAGNPPPADGDCA